MNTIFARCKSMGQIRRQDNKIQDPPGEIPQAVNDRFARKFF